MTPWTGENVTSLLLGKKVGFDHRLGQLLDEKRHPIRLDDDLLDDFARKLRAHHAFDQCRTLLAAQSIEGQGRDMVVRIPARLKLRAAGNDDEDGSVLDPVDQEIEHVSGGWVDPVGILKGDQQRPVARQPDQMIHQGDDDCVLLLLRRKLERSVSIVDGDRQQSREYRRQSFNVPICRSDSRLEA